LFWFFPLFISFKRKGLLKPRIHKKNKKQVEKYIIQDNDYIVVEESASQHYFYLKSSPQLLESN
jgi:hypothetical protein